MNLGRTLESVMTALDTRRGGARALAVLLVCHVALNMLWLRLDDHVIRIDEEFHAAGAQSYYYAWTNPALHGLGERLQAMAAITSPYPPLTYILGALTACVFGYSPDTIAFSASLCFVVVLAGIYCVGVQVFSPARALLCAIIASLIPLLFGGSRYVALENQVAACAVWGLFCLIRCDGFRKRGYVIAFGVVNGLAILAKPNAFVYYLLPAALVFALGLWDALRARQSRDMLRILLQGVLCVALTGIIALPWYVHHRASLERYWLSEHKGGKTPFSFTRSTPPTTPTATPQPAPPTLPERVQNPAYTTTAPPAPVATPAEAPKVEFDWSHWLPDREWAAYPILLINNGAFLPLTMLGVAGLLYGAWRHRRQRAFWMIVAWVLGSYLLNTLLFRYINPRYTMPFIGALAIGAVALMDALPVRAGRAAYVAVLLLGLAAQYLNISFIGSNRFDTWLHMALDHPRITYFQDYGLALTKSQVITGTYCFRAPAREENYVTHAFRAITAYEQAMQTQPGREIRYVTLTRQNNFGGFKFLESSYWPEPNPLLKASLRGKPEGQFRFKQVGYCNAPEEVPALFKDAEYVVTTLDYNDGSYGEGPGHSFYEALEREVPVHLVDLTFTPPYGLLPGAMVGVFARGRTPAFAGIEDFRGREAKTEPLDLLKNAMDLLALARQQATGRDFTEAERAERDTRLSAVLRALPAGSEVAPGIRLAGSVVDQPYRGSFRLRLLFQVMQAPGQEWRMYVAGQFNPADAEQVPDFVRKQGFYTWNFPPNPPTAQWQAGDFVLCTREFPCQPIRLDTLAVGFYNSSSARVGETIQIGPLDFAKMPINESALLKD